MVFQSECKEVELIQVSTFYLEKQEKREKRMFFEKSSLKKIAIYKMDG